MKQKKAKALHQCNKKRRNNSCDFNVTSKSLNVTTTEQGNSRAPRKREGALFRLYTGCRHYTDYMSNIASNIARNQREREGPPVPSPQYQRCIGRHRHITQASCLMWKYRTGRFAARIVLAKRHTSTAASDKHPSSRRRREVGPSSVDDAQSKLVARGTCTLQRKRAGGRALTLNRERSQLLKRHSRLRRARLSRLPRSLPRMAGRRT